MTGAELGYRYENSPLVWPEPGDVPAHDFIEYRPTTWPGARRSACSTFRRLAHSDLYEADLILLRPDMHIAWRGNRAPEDPARLARIATGHMHG